MFVLGSVQLHAQCSFDPVIEGDLIFCPDQTMGELVSVIQNADAYQWLSRPFSGGSPTEIPGATASTLFITNNDILNYFSVDVTISGCTERSPEVLIDQWVFLLPVVETTGDYIFDGSNFLICEGDSMFMTLMNPYDTNITWYRDGSPIPGENEQTLEVSTQGSYTVSGAPAICPNYIQFLGLDLVVIFNTDPNECDIMSVNDNETLIDLRVYPNPTNETINISADETISSITIVNILGQELYKTNLDALNTTIDLSSYAVGTYFVKVQIGDSVLTEKIIKE